MLLIIKQIQYFGGFKNTFYYRKRKEDKIGDGAGVMAESKKVFLFRETVVYAENEY